MSRSLRTILNESNPNKLASACEVLPAGDAMGLLDKTVSGAVTSNVMTLPNNAKCAAVLRAFATAGTTTGFMTPIPTGAPATTQVGVTPTGDIIFNAATDAVTAAEVKYSPLEGPVISDLIQVASSAGTLNQSRKAHVLISAVVVTGVAPGAVATCDARGTASPASGHYALQLNGTQVKFNAAQVVTGTVLVTYVAQPGSGTTPAAVGANLDAETQSF